VRAHQRHKPAHRYVSPITGDTSHHTDRINCVSTVTGRLGYAWDNWLFFAKGGWAWAGFEGSTNTTTPTGASVALLTSEETRDGWTVGGGIEWGVSQHVSVKLEYDYVKFQSANFNVSSTSFVQHAFGIFARRATSNLNMVKGGVAFDFSWPQLS
jgi:outer membrane immunogenic protein